MALSRLFTDFALNLHAKTAQAAGAVTIDGITEMSINSELQTVVEGADGSVFDSFGSLQQGKPTFTFTTKGVKGLLDACGLTGMLIDSDGTHPGVAAYLQKMKQGGTREAQDAGNHIEILVANGMMLLDTLTLTDKENATLSARVLGRQEGAVGPLQFNITANLPDVYPTLDNIYTVGPVNLNGAGIGGVSSISISFGITEVSESRDSDIHPSYIGIQTIKPVITLTASHADILDSLTPDGKYYAATEVIFYARKRAEGGTLVPDGTAEHIKFTLGKSRVDWTTVSGDPKDVNITITPWGTPGATPVLPITISTASAIT